jgi:hypothetical protein
MLRRQESLDGRLLPRLGDPLQGLAHDGESSLAIGANLLRESEESLFVHLEEMFSAA